MFRLQKQVYLDNNASTILSKKVRKKMSQVLETHFGNPSSPYTIGRQSASVISEAREAIAKSINADPYELYFTSSATEANNQVIKGLAEYARDQLHKTKIVSSPIEHPSIISTLDYLKEKGFDIVYLPVNRFGCVEIESIDDAIDDNTFLLCCMLANNEIGTLQSVAEIAAIAKKRGVLVLSDCVQALGKVDVDVKALGVDYVTLSAHKIHGPKGVGAVYVRDGAPFHALIHGGHQEAGLRAGTESIHNIAGFGEACKSVPDLLENVPDVEKIRNQLLENLKELRPDLSLNMDVDNCLPNTISVSFPGVSNATLMAVLDYHGVAVSAGSACSSGGSTPSHVLKAIGLTDNQADETIRISLSEYNTQKEIDYTITVVKDFFDGKVPEVRVLKPSQVDKKVLFDDQNYILDIRFWYERKLLTSMPNAHEVPFIGFKKYMHHIPKDKNIIVVCMGGIDATALAYSLHNKGFKNISVVLSGLAGWRLAQPELYKEFAGYNVVSLSPN